MSKSRVIVLSAVRQGLSIAEAARRFGVTWRWVHELVRRYEAGGLDALEPRPRRPRTNPNQVEAVLRERIIELRTTLTEAGWDAGPATIATHGTPAATLTDNGRVFTTRITGTRNGFEQLIASLGIQHRNGRPFHPQTQGKIERFHQTLKRWLAAQPAADDLTALQDQLDRFRHHYNHHRPHRALGRRTPQTAYDATIKATPADNRDQRDWRIRHDRVDRFGKLSLRRAGRMHHLGIGIDHAGTPVLILTDDTTVTVTDQATGEILATHTVDPTRTYWRNNDRSPGRWPGLLPDMNDDAEHL